MPTEQLIPLIVIAVVLPLVLLRNRKPRTLRPDFMWVTPLIVVALIGFGMWGMAQTNPEHAPTDPLSLFILAIGLALGGAAGWWRGKMVVIHKEADGTLKAQSSPLGLVLIIGLIVLRQAIRPWLEQNADAWHVNPLAIIEAFMLFAVGMVVMQRVEMWIRARKIQAGGADAHVEIEA